MTVWTAAESSRMAVRTHGICQRYRVRFVREITAVHFYKWSWTKSQVAENVTILTATLPEIYLSTLTIVRLLRSRSYEKTGKAK
jgi:hypothetical protein